MFAPMVSGETAGFACQPSNIFDATFVRLKQGFVYVVAVMDWFSRYVLSWRVSITQERLHQSLGYRTPAGVHLGN
jgi:transposase InsO family protein